MPHQPHGTSPCTSPTARSHRLSHWATPSCSSLRPTPRSPGACSWPASSRRPGCRPACSARPSSTRSPLRTGRACPAAAGAGRRPRREKLSGLGRFGGSWSIDDSPPITGCRCSTSHVATRSEAAMSERIGASPIVIVGGGIAGGNAAVTLREEGFRGRVVIISREPGVPFGRPPLSKTYLRSEEDLESWYVRPAGWYEEHDIDRLGESSVVAIDAAAHRVVLGSDQELAYQKVLIATGGRNRRLEIPGAELSGIHYLRTVADCDAIKREAAAGRRAVVVGMGFIGCEVAASLTQLGVRVTAVFPGRTPLETVLGGQVGALIGAIHRANGVELLPGEQVAAFEGTERLEAVVTAAGHRVPCDFAVAGIGVEPDIPAVAGLSIAEDNGIGSEERRVGKECRSRWSPDH